MPGQGTAINVVRILRVSPPARSVACRYLGAIAVGNLAWEALQLPLYTLWRTARVAYIAFAALHCWVGDMLIASVCLALAIVITGRGWPSRRYGHTAGVSVLLGVGYTIFSEWLNEHVRESWTYAAAMPRVPPFGTGLSPLLQLIAVPTNAFWWPRRAHVLARAPIQ